VLQINAIKHIKPAFQMEQNKMDCFCGMLIGLIKVRSINLAKITNDYPSEAEPDSRYRRMQRFIHDYPINFDTVAWFIMKRFNFDNQPFYLTLDRTNWQWGEMDINILVLALAYKGVAIPIYWLKYSISRCCMASFLPFISSCICSFQTIKAIKKHIDNHGF
jgi:hypothetical protein